MLLRRPHLLATFKGVSPSGTLVHYPGGEFYAIFARASVMEILWLHGRVEQAGCSGGAPWFSDMLGS